jgi:cellulose synthase/poly-beta-1,6-N-acetylglucosamine synthase-like glycosyltransferase
MTGFLLFLALLPAILFVYAYLAYPAVLWLLARRMSDNVPTSEPAGWPSVSVSVPVYNEARQIRALLESLLALDYPKDRLQILLISDCSSDGTDEIIREYEDRGIELLRLPERRGKTAGEQAAHPQLRGEIIVNTDASIRLRPDAIRRLVCAFQDPTIGVASGRDVSVGDAAAEGNVGESGYVGYEMWVRRLETRLGSIVGASGSLYAIRESLHKTWLPEMLSRDFASALIARENGYRAVSVNDAICVVPRTASLRREFKRKVRTMARGLDTLWYKRALMNPFRHGRFALMLISHKLARWVVYLTLPVSAVSLVLLSATWVSALTLLIAGVLVALLGGLALLWPAGKRVPRVLALPGFIVVSNVAGLLAWREAARRARNAVWEPTRRTL